MTGSPSLEAAIAAAPCVEYDWIPRCTHLDRKHPHCAEAAAKAWFHSYLESEEAVERGAIALHKRTCNDRNCDGSPQRHDYLGATVVTNALREGTE